MNAAFEDCGAFDQSLRDADRPWDDVFGLARADLLIPERLETL
jgi:hypothetical protein